MLEDLSDRYIETWVVVVNKTKYHLTGKQANVLKDAISHNLRGVVMFDEFAISVPFIEEFYLESKRLNPKYTLVAPEDSPISEEQARKNLRKLAEMKATLLRLKSKKS